jgi:cell envelope-related function transcriptional attenuator common domain
LSAPNNNVPNSWQILIAAVAGVSIGLYMSYGFGQPKMATSGPASARLPAASSQQPKQMMTLNLLPQLEHRTNLLLMGVDSNGRNTQRFLGTRSDTMIIASLDPVTHKVGMLSIPRDSRVKIPEHRGMDKINSAHSLGGPELAVKTVEAVFGIPIDNYVVIDTQGIKSVCEIVGPIKVLVEKRMKYRDRAGKLNVDLEPGWQELTAAQCEEYVRFRHDQKGDIGRIERQQWFLRQAMQKLKDPSVFLKIPDIIKFKNEYIVTDLDVKTMTALAAFGKELKSTDITTAALPGEASTIHGGSYWIPDPEATAFVVERLTGVRPSVSQIAYGTSPQEPVVDVAYENDQFGMGPAQATQAISNDTLQAKWAESATSERPFGIVIRYPKGQEETAHDFQSALEDAGYNVRGLVRCKDAECQHESITLSSFRADEQLCNALKQRFPELSTWAVTLNPVARNRVDLTLQLSPETVPLPPHETVSADFDYGISDIINGEVKPGKNSAPDLELPRS